MFPKFQYGAGLEDLEPDFNQLDYISDSGEEEDWWNDRNYIQSGVKVQVQFSRCGGATSNALLSNDVYVAIPLVMTSMSNDVYVA
jgi:hypothetical protein